MRERERDEKDEKDERERDERDPVASFFACQKPYTFTRKRARVLTAKL